MPAICYEIIFSDSLIPDGVGQQVQLMDLYGGHMKYRTAQLDAIGG